LQTMAKVDVQKPRLSSRTLVESQTERFIVAGSHGLSAGQASATEEEEAGGVSMADSSMSSSRPGYSLPAASDPQHDASMTATQLSGLVHSDVPLGERKTYTSDSSPVIDADETFGNSAVIDTNEKGDEFAAHSSDKLASVDSIPVSQGRDRAVQSGPQVDMEIAKARALFSPADANKAPGASIAEPVRQTGGTSSETPLIEGIKVQSQSVGDIPAQDISAEHASRTSVANYERASDVVRTSGSRGNDVRPSAVSASPARFMDQRGAISDQGIGPSKEAGLSTSSGDLSSNRLRNLPDAGISADDAALVNHSNGLPDARSGLVLEKEDSGEAFTTGGFSAEPPSLTPLLAGAPEENSPSRKAPLIVSEGSTRLLDVRSPGPVVGTEPTRPIRTYAPQTDPGRTANLTVESGDGQTTTATVREREGSVEVKIVTSSSAAAERISHEMDSMRQNLDAAGLRLGHSDVSYRQERSAGRDRDQYQPQPQTNKPSKEIFTLSEVSQ